MGGAIAVGCFELVAYLAVPSHRQAFGGYCRSCDVTAKAFQLIPFMSPGGDASMEREASYLAHRVCKWAVWPAVRQGLQREHFTPLLWAHRDAGKRAGPHQDMPFLLI